MKSSKILAILILIVIFFVFLFYAKTYFYKDILIYDNCIRTVHALVLITLTVILNKKLNLNNFVKPGDATSILKSKSLFLPSIILLIYFWFNTNFENLKTINQFGIVLLFLATFLSASAEEFVFRFFCSNFLLNRGFKLNKTAILTSLLFAFSHLNNIRYANNWASPVNQVSIAFFSGLLFISIIFITQKFWVSSLMHFLINSPNAINDLVGDSVKINVVNNFNFVSNLSSVLIVHLIFSPIIIISLSYYNKLNNNIYQTKF